MHAPSDVEVAERQARATKVYALELATARRRFNEVFRTMNRFEMRRDVIDIADLVQPTIEKPLGYADIETRDLTASEVLEALGKTVPTERGAGRIAPLPSDPPPTAKETQELMAGWWDEVPAIYHDRVDIEEGKAYWEGHEVTLSDEAMGRILDVVASAVADKLKHETERLFGKVRTKWEKVEVQPPSGGAV